MGSVDFNSPPRNVTLVALSAVIGLHVLAAMALVTIKPTIPIDKIVKESTPIEIQMLTLPMEQEPPKPVEVVEKPPELEAAPIEVEVNVEPELNPHMMVNTEAFQPELSSEFSFEPPTQTPESLVNEPKVVEQAPPPIVPEKKVQPKAEAPKIEHQKIVRATPPEPVVEQDIIVKETFIEETTPKKPIPKKTVPEKIVPEKVIPEKTVNQEVIAAQALAAKQQQAAAQNAQRAAEEAANRKAQQEAAQRDRQAAADAQAIKNAAEKAAREKAAQQAQAARDAEAAAKAQADAKAKADAKAQAKADAAKAEAASNTPMNFNASSANWRSPPNFSFPDRASRGASSGDTFNVVLVLRVNKQGGIDSVRLAQSSGNALLDREAQRQVRSGKFTPFTNDAGVPVVGNVTLPVSYAVP